MYSNSVVEDVESAGNVKARLLQCTRISMSEDLIYAFWGLIPPGTRKDDTMPKSLDELLTLKGVIASGEFAANGKLINIRSKGVPLPDDVTGLTAQFAAAISQLLGALAAAHSRISGLNWVPAQGWAFSGGDLTIAVGGSRGVFVKTAEADFNQLFEALIGPRQLSPVGER